MLVKKNSGFVFTDTESTMTVGNGGGGGGGGGGGEIVDNHVSSVSEGGQNLPPGQIKSASSYPPNTYGGVVMVMAVVAVVMMEVSSISQFEKLVL